jgi:predicted phage terminase large subunit-like protein
MWTARQAKIYELRLQREKLRREAERSLAAFSAQAWEIIEPGRRFENGWHIEAVSEHLEAVQSRQIRNLIINLPPRHMKSILSNVAWPAWVWGPRGNPAEEWIFGSYSPKLSVRDAVKTRRILDSEWYQGLWAERFMADRDRREIFNRTGSLLAEDQNEKANYRNIHSGARISTSIGGAGTGLGGDIIVCDDPHKVGKVESEVEREKAITWWVDEMATRGNDPATVCKVLIMQRVHESDLTGYLVEHQQGQWDHLLLPFEYDPKIQIDMGAKTALKFEDPREREGERLWKRYEGEPGDKLVASLKPYQRSGQLQQKPTSKEGEIFKRKWFQKRWHTLPERFQFFITTWDLTFGSGEEAKGAYDVGYALGWYQGNYYVVDEIRRRLEPHEQELECMKLKKRWPNSRGILIEDAANGKATGKKIKRKVSGVLLIKPVGSKEERAEACTDVFQAENVLFPADEVRPWAAEAIEEIVGFSARAKFKDRVDALCQGITYLEPKVAKRALISSTSVDGMEKVSIYAEIG